MGQNYLEKKIGHRVRLRVNSILFSGELSLIGNLLRSGCARAVSPR